MFRRFLLTLLSSWVVNPLGVAVAHGFGVANTPTVLLLLLGTGACVPFQLFMNECLAAGAERARFEASPRQLAAVVIMQSLAYAISVMTLSSLEFRTAEVVVLGGLLAASTLLSYRISMSYYRLVIRGSISMRQAVVIGALPGLVALAIYLGYCMQHRWQPALSSEVLLLVSILPALTQWAYVHSLGGILSRLHPVTDIRGAGAPRVAHLALFLAITVLAALTMAGSFLRESIASRSLGHMALILVGLNSLVSLANTVTRSAFLSQNHGPRPIALKIALAIAAVVSIALWKVAPTASLFAALIASQLGIVVAVESGRRIRTTAPSHQAS